MFWILDLIMENKNITAINENMPTTVDDLNLVEVLDVEFGIKSAMINGEMQLPEGVSMPSDADIAAAKESLLLKYQQNLYTKYRSVAYPNIREQLDALYHDIINGNLNAENSSFVSMISAVKQQYPKAE